MDCAVLWYVIFATEKYPCVNGPTQFKAVLFRAVNRTVRRHFARFSLALKKLVFLSPPGSVPHLPTCPYTVPAPFSQIPSSVSLPMLRLLCKSFPNASWTPGPPPHRGTCLPWVLFQLGALLVAPLLLTPSGLVFWQLQPSQTPGCYDRHPCDGMVSAFTKPCTGVLVTVFSSLGLNFQMKTLHDTREDPCAKTPDEHLCKTAAQHWWVEND